MTAVNLTPRAGLGYIKRVAKTYTGPLRRRRISRFVYDPNAAAYLAAVESADGQALEEGVKLAINGFVVGCKADGIWSAIKAACILCGARTRAGARTPLVGPTPTEHGTAGGWNYNRRTGLAGNGTDNYLDSGRNNNADPQNNHHLAVYASSIQVNTIMGARNGIPTSTGIGGRLVSMNLFRDVPNTDVAQAFGSAVGGNSTFAGTSRTNGSDYVARIGGASSTITSTSTTPVSASLFVFAQNIFGVGPQSFTASRLSFYSAGENLTLSTLDTRLTTLMAAIQAAIP